MMAASAASPATSSSGPSPLGWLILGNDAGGGRGHRRHQGYRREGCLDAPSARRRAHSGACTPRAEVATQLAAGSAEAYTPSHTRGASGVGTKPEPWRVLPKRDSPAPAVSTNTAATAAAGTTAAASPSVTAIAPAPAAAPVATTPFCRFRLLSLRTPRGCVEETACHRLAGPVSTGAPPRRRAVLPAAAGRGRPYVLCQWPNHARGSGGSDGGYLRGCADVDGRGGPPPPAPLVVPLRPPHWETRRRRSQLREAQAPAP